MAHYIHDEKNNLIEGLSKEEINCGVHYRDNTEYSMYKYAQGTCPKSHEVSEHLITMPLHMWLTNDDVAKIIKAVNKYA